MYAIISPQKQNEQQNETKKQQTDRHTDRHTEPSNSTNVYKNYLTLPYLQGGQVVTPAQR